MFQWLKKLWGDRRGNVLAIAGAALPVLVGAAGLATDTIEWTLWKRELQRAADSAAIAGVYQREGGGDEDAATGAVNHDLTLNQHTGLDLEADYPQITFPDDAGSMRNQVRVVLAVKKALPFSSMFMLDAPTIIAGATAASVPGVGDPCVRALEKDASKSGIIITGNAEINMPDCTMHSNSPATNSAYAKGSAEVYAEAVSAVGGIQESDNWHISSYDPYSPEIDDPYKDIDPNPADMKCAGHWETHGPKTEWVADALTESTDMETAVDINGDQANCWTSLNVGSSGALDVPADFGPIYVNGGDAFIQGDMNCTGCTVVLTNSDPSDDATIGQFKVNASSKTNLIAPTDGTYRGIAVFQDRRAKDSASAQNKINGNSDSVITGALYFPSQELDYNGTGSTSASCTMFVSRRISFSGNSATSNKFKSLADCGDVGLPSDGGTRRVRLVA
jgi:hypothetical protein